MISGAIYEIPAESVVTSDGAVTFKVPVYDAPGIIGEKQMF